MPVATNFKEWLSEFEGFFVFENVKPIPNKVKNMVLDNIIKNSHLTNPEEKQKLKSKAEKLIADFERFRGYPTAWWMAEPRVVQGTPVPGMNDPVLNTEIIPQIAPNVRHDISQYSNIKQLEKVIDQANNVQMFPKEIGKSLKNSLIKKFVENSKGKGDINEEQAKSLLSKFEYHRKYYKFDDWKAFLLKKSEDGIEGMGDEDFSLAEPQMGIPDIPHEQRFNLNNYEYYQQLEKLTDRLDSANLFGNGTASIDNQNKDEENKDEENKDAAENLSDEQKLAISWPRQKAITKGIEVVHEDDDYIIYRPKEPEEAILIKDAEPSMTMRKPSSTDPLDQGCPTWCICEKNTSNYFNTYKFGYNLTFYIVKNKKIWNISKLLMTKDRQYEFFVIGVPPEGRWRVTKQPNGDIEMTQQELLQVNGNMKKYLPLFVHVPLNHTEKTLQERFKLNITAQQFEDLSIKKVLYFKDGQEITNPETIENLKLNKELPTGITSRTVNERDMFLSICGINNDIKFDVFNLFDKDQKNRYVGYNKFINNDIVEYIIDLANRGEPGLRNRHLAIVMRILETAQAGSDDLKKLETIPAYGKLLSEKIQEIPVEYLGKLGKKIISQLYLAIPDKNIWFEKFSIENNNVDDLLKKFDDDAKAGWLKAEIQATGLKNTLSDNTYLNIFKSLSSATLAEFIKEYPLKSIVDAVALDKIRTIQSGDWNVILKYKSFNEIMEFVPQQIVQNLNTDAICTSYMSGDEASANTIKEYFKNKFGNYILAAAYPDPNTSKSILVNFYKMNDKRFQNSVDPEYLSKIEVATITYFMENLQQHSDSFSKFYFENTSHFKPGIIKKLIVMSKNYFEMSKKIIEKLGDNITAGDMNEILTTNTYPQDSKKLFEILKSKLNLLSGDDVVDLIDVHGPKHAFNNLGQEIYLRHEQDDEDKPKTHKFADFQQKLNTEFAKLAPDMLEEKDMEEKALAAYKGYIASLLQKYKVKNLEDASLTDDEKNKLEKLKTNYEDAKIADDAVAEYNKFKSELKMKYDDESYSEQDAAKLKALRNAATFATYKTYLRQARNPMAKLPHFHNWQPHGVSQAHKDFIMKGMFGNPNLKIPQNTIADMLRTTTLSNFDDVWTRIVNHNPENVQFIKRLDPREFNRQLGAFVIIKPSPRILASFINLVGEDLIKQSLDAIYNTKILNPNQTSWTSAATSIKKAAMLTNSQYFNAYNNFAVKKLDKIAESLGVPTLQQRVTPEVYDNMMTKSDED